ncbi:MAG: homoserine kinase, partial [Candidatus Rokuibacteriota bacterium]
LHNEVVAAPADRVTVRVEGEGAGRLPTDERNVVARGVRLAFDEAGRSFTGCALRCLNRIPAARGLGSSAAAWVGGLMAGNALMGSPLTTETLLGLAARAEGHPDNVAAALLGGLTVSCDVDGHTLALRLPVPSGLHWIVLVPEVTSLTADARAVLPVSVSRADAVFNVQRVSLLLAALRLGRVEVLRTAMDDRLHQPYRERLFPWMPRVTEAARAAGALGCVLSGAGPSLLAVVADGAQSVAQAMETALAETGMRGAAKVLAADEAGATLVSGPP